MTINDMIGKMKRSTRIVLVSAIASIIAMFYVLMRPAGEPLEAAMLTFRFDDGYVNQIPALELLKANEIGATVYCITGYIGKGPYLSWEDIGRLYEGGHEIGSHTVNHPSLMFITEKRIDEELRKSAEMLREKGIASGSFATPYGLMNPLFRGITKKYYRNAVDYPVIIAGGLNYANADKWKIASVVPRTAVEFSGLLRLAVRKKAWMVACFHGIGGDGSRYSISMEEFTAMVNFAAEMREKGLVDIVTVSEGAERLRRE
jgi:peptidoglycan/xylan/chitin deacetylase (PgdA/CDA1 family)